MVYTNTIHYKIPDAGYSNEAFRAKYNYKEEH